LFHHSADPYFFVVVLPEYPGSPCTYRWYVDWVSLIYIHSMTIELRGYRWWMWGHQRIGKIVITADEPYNTMSELGRVISHCRDHCKIDAPFLGPVRMKLDYKISWDRNGRSFFWGRISCI
jgi:hypothetical protein